MVVGIRDAAKMLGIMIVSGCAVFVCTLFLNFQVDIVEIRDQITSEQVMIFYDAQVSTAKMVSALCGGCLLVTSIIMLMFYIKHYIDTHKKELGILKALGYSRVKIAGNFWIFGSGVFFGTAFGYVGAYLLMPAFYKVQNQDGILPEIIPHFHPWLLFELVAVPTLLFTIISIFYSFMKLKKPALTLLRDNWQLPVGKKKRKQKQEQERPFLEEMRRGTLREKKVLAFFMINGNKMAIAMMRVFGYSQSQCCSAVLGGYRPMGYIGFAVGTVYQYVLLKIAVYIVFKDIVGVPDYQFDFQGMAVSLAAFVVIYELVMGYYSNKIKKVSVKEVMLEP